MKLNRYSLIVIVVIASIVILAQVVQAVVYEGKFEYEIKSGTVVITNYIGNSDRLAIPYKIGEVKYAKIVSEAFVGSGLKKIVILNNVKKIEKNAFDRDVTIYGKIDSEAQRYANENNMPFRIYCDINGDENVTPTDILQVKKHIVELKGSELNEEGQERADLNCDGKVTTTDLLKLKLVAVGLDEQNEVVNPVNPDNPDEPELPKEPENEPELPEEPEFPDEPEPTATPEPTVAPEEYVTVKYVTDPSLYPENSELASIKKQFNRLEGTMWKDISQKEYKVKKGEKYNSTNEIPTLSLKWRLAYIIYTEDACTTQPSGHNVIYASYPGDGCTFKGWIDIDGRGYKDGTKLEEDITLYACYEFNEIVMEDVDKPILYFYPTEKTEINVKMIYPDRLTVSYPKYPKDGWKILAEPDGTLTDLMTRRKLYCLYYEARSNLDLSFGKNGFIVKGEESAKFLEEKLAILGLNEREAEEFIVYWLPKLEANKYNYIRFAEEEYINENMPLEIKPEPETIIRVLMEFKGLEEPIDMEEQVLKPVTRKGYTVVEWGGTEL